MKSLFFTLMFSFSFQLIASDFYSIKYPVNINTTTLELRYSWVQEKGKDREERSWFVSFSDLEKEDLAGSLKVKGKFQHKALGTSYEVILDDDARAFLDGMSVLNNMRENDLNQYIRLNENEGSLDAHIVNTKEEGVYQILLENIKRAEFKK